MISRISLVTVGSVDMTDAAREDRTYREVKLSIQPVLSHS